MLHAIGCRLVHLADQMCHYLVLYDFIVRRIELNLADIFSIPEPVRYVECKTLDLEIFGNFSCE